MKQHPVMIGIAGGSCSGKTQLANAIIASLPSGDAVAIGLDSYYLDRPPVQGDCLNYDHPNALEESLIITQVNTLSRGEPIQKPVYDYASHRICSHAKLIQPKCFVIVEGLYALYWQEVRNLLTIRAFIDLDHTTCLERRLARDTIDRGRTPDSVIRQYRETVRPMYDRYIHPTKTFANLMLDGKLSIENLASEVRKSLLD